MSNQIINHFIVDLNKFLLNFVQKNCPEQEFSDFKPIINRENGSKIRGDFSLNFISPKFQILLKLLPQICEQLITESKQWNSFSIQSFKICEKIKKVLLFVFRSTALPKLIPQFTANLNKNLFKEEENYCVICADINSKNKFTSERIRFVSLAVSKLVTTSYIDLNLREVPDKDLDQLLSLIENSSFCESNVNNKLLLRIPSEESNEQCLLIDKSCRIIFELIYNFHDLIRSHIKCDKKSIIIVTSESLTYKLSQAFRLLCLLYDLNINFRLISVSNVNTDLDFDQYVRDIGDTLLQQNDSSFEGSDGFQTIVKTSITLSLMSTSPASVITRMESYLSESTFIQYNCARLKAIISRYETEFNPIPTEESLDLSLLDNDFEWSLVFNYFSNYLSIIDSFNSYFRDESNQKILPINQLILFVKDFVSEISIYYKKVKVLIEPSPHLLSLIAVRIYFCKISLKLLIQCLNILGLDSVERL